MSNWNIKQTIDLSRGHEPVVVWPNALLVPGNHAAHTWQVEVKQYGKPVDLSGFTVKGLFTRSGINETLSIKGNISGNVASVVFEMECYVEGPLRGIMELSNSSMTMAICETYFSVRKAQSNNIVVPTGRPAGNGETFYVTLSSAEDGSITADKTLAEVEEAFADGRNIYCLAPEEDAYLILPMVARIPGELAVFNVTAGNSTLTARLAAEAVLVEHSPLTLQNALTFTGSASGRFDGSSPVTINIPAEGTGSSGSSDGATEDDLALPSYWQTHLSERVVSIREAMTAAGWNKSAFLWYHDAHWTYNYQQSPQLLKYLSQHTPVNKVFFGGDIVYDEGEDAETMSYLWAWRDAIRSLPRHHSVPGNHDDGNDTDNRWDDAYIYAYLLAAEETPDVIRGDALYYYIDEPAEHTRYLFLDTATKDGNILNDAVQEAWLKSTLLSTPAEWHIVAISHIWLTVDYDVDPPVATGFSMGGQICLDMFDAYNSRTDDFAACTGKVEFCIGGHSHVDADYTSSGGIPVILTECDSRNVRSGLECTEGTTSENSVNAIIADYTNGYVSVIRIGRGSSRIVQLDGSGSTEQPDDTGDDTTGEEDTTWMNVSLTRVKQTSDDTVALEWNANVDGVTYVVFDNGTEVAQQTSNTQIVLFNIAAGEHIYTIRPQKSETELGNVSESLSITTVESLGYTNVLRTCVDTDGSLYNGGLGYKENTRISSSDYTEKTATGWDCTGYIPIARGDVVRIYDADYYDIDDTGGDDKRCFVLGCSADFASFTVSTNPLADAWNPVLDDDGDLIQFTMVSSWTNDDFIRLTAKNIDAFSIITINEEIAV